MSKPMRFLVDSFLLTTQKSDMRTTRFGAYEMRIIVGDASSKGKRENRFPLIFFCFTTLGLTTSELVFLTETYPQMAGTILTVIISPTTSSYLVSDYATKTIMRLCEEDVPSILSCPVC
jgi:hypothetical protein